MTLREPPQPGVRTARLYVWLVLLSPVLLIAASVGLLVVGLSHRFDALAVLGGIGIIGGLLLPRLQGAFEIGPSGVKGSQVDELFRQLITEGMRQGLPLQETVELAVEATELETSLPVLLASPHTHVADAIVESRQQFATALASRHVAEGVELHKRVQATVRRVAESKGWRIQTEVRPPADDAELLAEIPTVDLVVETESGVFLVEPAAVRSSVSIGRRVRQVEESVRRLQATLGIVVVPERSASTPASAAVRVVRIDELESQLAEL